MQELYRAHDQLASNPVVVLPAMAFYGGLSDLMATAAADGWAAVDEITVAIGLDRWLTDGTRRTGRRNTATRLVIADRRLVPAPTPASEREWVFPEPIGRQSVVGNPFSGIITISRHLDASRIRTYLSACALADIHDPATPGPQATDDSGRSAQQFAVDVAVRRGDEVRRIAITARDIYAVTAPLVAEAVQRLLDGRALVHGVVAPGQAFDAADFLAAPGPGT